MSSRRESQPLTVAPDDESDATDGGWDPYVTALMCADRHAADKPADADHEAEPVRSFSSKPMRRLA